MFAADPQRLVLRTISSVPPQVLAVEMNADQIDPPDLPSGPQPSSWMQQRSGLLEINVTFSQDVQVTAADLQLVNLGVNAPMDQDTIVPIDAAQLELDGQQLTLAFAPSELPDGVYQLTILPTVTNAGGQPLDGDGDGSGGDAFVHEGDAGNRFYRLSGDWNGDGGVSVFDFATFAYWLGSRSAWHRSTWI